MLQLKCSRGTRLLASKDSVQDIRVLLRREKADRESYVTTALSSFLFSTMIRSL